MKLKTYILTLMAMLLLLASCSKDEAVVTVLSPDSLFTTTTIQFEGVAGEQHHTIKFNAPKAWTAEIHNLGTWLKADRTYGEAGAAEITIRPTTDNFAATARTATLEIYIDGYEAYTINVNQSSASTGDIVVNGNISDGIMTLRANDNGTEFSDTIYVESNKAWELAADADGIMSFEKEGEPHNGEATRVRLIVKADYSKFTSPTYQGQFYIKTNEGTALPITVNASAHIGIFATELSQQDEHELVSLTMSDAIQTGVFSADFFVESNVRWTLAALPEWIESSVSWGSATEITNVQSDGKISRTRQHVSLRVKDTALSVDGKTATINIRDARGETIKSLSLIFAGVGRNYVSFSAIFPSNDPNGNPWGFEAKASSVDPDSPTDYWKKTEHPVTVTTSVDYKSINDAPFHLLLVRADNGIARQEEAHWAHLEMGTASATYNGSLYTRDIIIRANDRGDSDDKAGITDPTKWRYAFIYIVPENVTFADLWNADGTLKPEYADNTVIMSQKNDTDAEYKFGFDEVSDGGILTVPATGGSITLNVTPGSYTSCDVVIENQNADGSWSTVSDKVCTMAVSAEGDDIRAITFTLSKNEGERNPFTGAVVGSDRHIRIRIEAFLGDDIESRTIFTFYIDQELAK